MGMPPANNHRPSSDYFPTRKKHTFSRILLLLIPILMLGSLIYFGTRSTPPSDEGSSLTEKDILIHRVVYNTKKIKDEISSKEITDIAALKGFNLIKDKELELTTYKDTSIFEDAEEQVIDPMEDVLAVKGILFNEETYTLVIHLSFSSNEIIVMGQSRNHSYTNQEDLK